MSDRIFYTEHDKNGSGEHGSDEDEHSDHNNQGGRDDLEGEILLEDLTGEETPKHLPIGINHHLPIFVIRSNQNLSKIIGWIISETGGTPGLTLPVNSAGRIGPIRIIRGRNGRETDFSLVIMDENLYNILETKGFSTPPPSKENRDKNQVVSQTPTICRFNFSKDHYPGKWKNSNVFMALPQNMTSQECQNEIEMHLKTAVAFGLITGNSYNINIKLKTREMESSDQGTDHCGRAFIEFKESVEIERIIAVMEMMQHTIWYQVDPQSSKKTPTKYRFETNWADARNIPSSVRKERVMMLKKRTEERKKKSGEKRGHVKASEPRGSRLESEGRRIPEMPAPGVESEQFPNLPGTTLTNSELLVEKRAGKKTGKKKLPATQTTTTVTHPTASNSSPVQVNHSPVTLPSTMAQPVSQFSLPGGQTAMDPNQMQTMMMMMMMNMMNQMNK